MHRSEICLIAASYLYGSILCIGDGTITNELKIELILNRNILMTEPL